MFRVRSFTFDYFEVTSTLNPNHFAVGDATSTRVNAHMHRHPHRTPILLNSHRLCLFSNASLGFDNEAAWAPENTALYRLVLKRI
jgi:hypothetical protein